MRGGEINDALLVKREPGLKKQPCIFFHWPQGLGHIGILSVQSLLLFFFFFQSLMIQHTNFNWRDVLIVK